MFLLASFCVSATVTDPVLRADNFVSYPRLSHDLRKTNIIKNNTKKKKNYMTVQAMEMFCSYKKVCYKNQINQRYSWKLQMFEDLWTKL
jgi:hypothetical protein